MTTAAAELYLPVARYAERLHASAGDRHHVASPLGAWLLLALAAGAATGPVRDELAGALGADVPAAGRIAAALLAEPHPAVLAAAGTWVRPDARTDALRAWLSTLPPQVGTGDLPPQADLDAWAREHTTGLIERFPLTLTPQVMLVMATALATRVSWERPFELAPAAELGPSAALGVAGSVLHTPAGRGHDQFIAATERAGDVAVHAARAREGLTVVSVAAAPDVPAVDVLAAAYDLAPTVAAGRPGPRRSLWGLPLGDGPAWTLTERRALTTAPDGREERCTAVLPAWSARSEHELGLPELGFPAAAGAIAGLVGPGFVYQARQAAVARYHRVGFEAAAVSAMMVLTSAPVERDGLVRTARLRFGHPYAVVAVATGGGPWAGLPVFSAWVAEPEAATAEQ